MKETEMADQNFNQQENRDAASLPDFLQSRPMHLLDVRPVLARGEEPFPLIMRAAESVESDQVLQLVAPFEPVPLYGVLGRKGLQHWSRQNSSEGEPVWEIFFYREEFTIAAADEKADGASDSDEDGEAIQELDVRGLEPPEPLEQVLEMIATLSYGDVLLVHHHRNPLILFDMLEERGCAYRSTEVSEDYWQVRIWRRG